VVRPSLNVPRVGFLVGADNRDRMQPIAPGVSHPLATLASSIGPASDEPRSSGGATESAQPMSARSAESAMKALSMVRPPRWPLIQAQHER
jgi:hypothetical protein